MMTDDATLRVSSPAAASTPPSELSSTTSSEPPAPTSAMRQRIAPFIWGAIFIVVASIPVGLGVETWLHFSGSAIDGPFQLYDALRRIQGGFRPGVGFQYFHGLGLPYLHYWLFRLTGGGLSGSEEIRELLSPLAYLAVLVIFFRAFTGRWVTTWCLATIALALSIVLHLDALTNAQNGMMGLRSTLPTLLPIPMALVRNRRWRTAIVGAGLGLSMFVSTEQGLAAFAAYVVISAILVARRGDRRPMAAEAGVTLALGLAVFLAALTAVGGLAGMRGALRYNLRDVSMDQFWYFGTPPAQFISSWSFGFHLIRGAPLICWALVLGVIAAAAALWRLWSGPLALTPRRRAFAFLTAYGIISCASLLGIFVTAYVATCWRALILLSVLWAYERLRAATLARGGRLTFEVPSLVAAVAVTSPVWMFMLRPLTRIMLLVMVPHVVNDHVLHRQGFTMGSIWPQTLAEGQRVLDQHRGPHGELPTLWSTYAGWIEARNGIYKPSFDYIIHALGPENRASYLQSFETTQPELVQTVLPTYSRFEAWIEATSWDFYAHLLRNYTVADATPWSLYWARRATPLPQPIEYASMQPPPGAAAFAIPTVPASGALPYTLVQVEVSYDVHNPLHVVPLLGDTPRYLITIGNAVTTQPMTLDPYEHVARFPVLAQPGTEPKMIVRVFSLLPGASVAIHSLRASVVPLDAADAPWLQALVLEQSGRGHPSY